ncbi:MAG: aminoacyl-tRNA hydrolase [Pseudomonadota bacterium]|nr:aminoacyl-tRNA hydrolase [Pseudomonadota bacterium]
MRLLVGLGNPGERYARNRHNVGFMAVDEIVHRHGFSPWRVQFQGAFAQGEIAGKKVLALKPMTYMNLSGRSVGAAARYYKIAPENVIVFHDELDISPNRFKVRLGGGTAGHKGLRSIDAHLGNSFWRVRIGIGHPGMREIVEHWVLQDFPKASAEWLVPMLEAMAIELPLLLAEQDSHFMSKVYARLRPRALS